MKGGVKKILFFFLDLVAPFFDKDKPIEKGREKKILVVEAGGIGDLVRVLPAIECLQDNFPDAAVSLLASPVAREVLRLFPRKHAIANVMDFDLEGAHKSFFAKLSLISTLRKNQYDLIYSPDRGEGMRERVLMNFLVGASDRIGFKRGRVGCLNTLKIEFREDIPILDQNLALLEAAGLRITKQDIELQIPEEDKITAERLLAQSDGMSPFPLISIHPGASWRAEYRSWPVDKYMRLIKALRQKLGAKVVIVGSKKETATGEKIVDEVQDPAVINLIGKTTITQMAAVIGLSHLFVGNDSGPLHIALALRTPSVGIFGATSPEQVLSDPGRCAVVKKHIPGAPRYLHQHDFSFDAAHIESLDLITVDDVMNEIAKVLGKAGLSTACQHGTTLAE